MRASEASSVFTAAPHHLHHRIPAQAPPPVRWAGPLDFHRRWNPTVNCACKGSRLHAPQLQESKLMLSSTCSHWFCIMVGYYIIYLNIIYSLYISQCNNNRNKVHNKCYALVSSLKTISPTLPLVYDCLPWDLSLVPKILETADLQNYQVMQSKITTRKELIARREKNSTVWMCVSVCLSGHFLGGVFWFICTFLSGFSS